MGRMWWGEAFGRQGPGKMLTAELSLHSVAPGDWMWAEGCRRLACVGETLFTTQMESLGLTCSSGASEQGEGHTSMGTSTEALQLTMDPLS